MRAVLRRLSGVQILAIGFMLIIFIGAALLSLPVASRGVRLPYLDALFTSVSATCVTGLVLRDTWTQFSFFGQFIIFLLMQIGGLGFITIIVQFFIVLGQRIGLRERSLISESISTNQVGGVVRLMKRVLIGTAFFESLGAILLSIRFIPKFGLWRGIWFSLFHSVSAFCNASFDLMDIIAPRSSMESFRGDALVILTICGLIFVGGIGFIVWNDVVESVQHHKKLSLHTLVCLIGSVVLILFGTLVFWLLERNGVLAKMPGNEAALTSLFLSATPRTSGFSMVNIAKLSDTSKLFAMMLMFIGASPGGTGGGIKVSTFVIILAAIRNFAHSREDVSLWKYRLEPDTVRHAFCYAALYALAIVAGVTALCLQGVPLVDSAFESISAIGTVGLSTGITPFLGVASKIAIILLMYVGRVGSMTVFMAITIKRTDGKLKNPVGSVIVG